MPSPDEVFGEIEVDRANREREIRLLKNSAQTAATRAEKDMLLRVLILLTYSHLEGSCRFAFEAYVAALNAMALTCDKASYALVAATLTRALSALRNPTSKHPFFVRVLPDDTKLHLVAREREFVESLDKIVKSRIDLPDMVVDTESNLSSTVLRKNLYRLGLDLAVVDVHQGQIDKLLGIRNAIAHGDSLRVPAQKDADDYVSSAFAVMQFVQYQVFSALSNKSYLRV
ncbi:MAG: MAE_28990/MAE_18760 family HEPN-like nuclease [Hyphomicrobium sp.]|jgi:hypothetical protein